MMLIMMMEVVISSRRDLMIHGCGEDHYREFLNGKEHHFLNDALPLSFGYVLTTLRPIVVSQHLYA